MRKITVKNFCLSCFTDIKDGADQFCSDFCKGTFFADTTYPWNTTDPAIQSEPFPGTVDDGDYEEDGDDEELRVVWHPVRVVGATGWRVSTMRGTQEGERHAE